MLQKMEEMRARGMRPDPQKEREAARAAIKPEPPMVLTSEDVKRIAAGGSTIDRSNFRLMTRGHGPIGAPTMTLDQVSKRACRGEHPTTIDARARLTARPLPHHRYTGGRYGD